MIYYILLDLYSFTVTYGHLRGNHYADVALGVSEFDTPVLDVSIVVFQNYISVFFTSPQIFFHDLPSDKRGGLHLSCGNLRQLYSQSLTKSLMKMKICHWPVIDSQKYKKGIVFMGIKLQ